MTDSRKAEFWWASVAGAKCEPVEVAMKEGERVAYTCGCADPFYLDRPDCPVVLVPTRRANHEAGQMDRQLTSQQEKRADAAHRRQLRELESHRWRGDR